MIRKAFQNAYFVGLMAVVGIAAVAFQIFNGMPKRHERNFARGNPVAQAPVAAAVSPALGQEPVPDIAQIPWGNRLARNPFQAVQKPSPSTQAAQPEKTSVTPPSPKLSAVSIQQSSRLAILNGRVVGEGDMLQEWKVRTIFPDHVVVDGPRGQASVHFSKARQ
jgi:hypothetical protein